MTTRTNPDGTIEVRVVLYVTVDPAAWAHNMMGDHPNEVLQSHVRASVKGYCRNLIDHASKELRSNFSDIDPVPIKSVVPEDNAASPVSRRS